MKKYSLLFFTLLIFQISYAQKVSISVDKMNILYSGIDNPITIAVENNSNKSLIVKASDGKITGQNGKYIFTANEPGKSEITVFKKQKNKMTRIGSAFFRVKAIPLPTFKIGRASHSMVKVELANQQYVRAELDGFDFDARFSIDSFSVCIVTNDTCKHTVIKNIGGKINEEIRNEFQKMKENDVVIFKNIFAQGPDGSQMELIPVMITIYK